MKRVIHIPDRQNVILTDEIDFDKTQVKVIDELPFEKGLIGYVTKTDKNKWLVRSERNGLPVKFETTPTLIFESIDDLFLLLNMEGYSTYTE
jgi:hypothetical protein